MAHVRFDHLLVEPTSFEASCACCRDTLGWHEQLASRACDADGGLIAFEQRPSA
jgi:hypothetical protein